MGLHLEGPGRDIVPRAKSLSLKTQTYIETTLLLLEKQTIYFP